MQTDKLTLSGGDKKHLVMFRNIVDYGSSLLTASSINLDKLSAKEKYLLLVFTAVNNYAEGIFVLCNEFRPEAAVVVLRGLVEAYINTAFTLSHNSNNRLHLLYIEDSFSSIGMIEEIIRFYNKYRKLRPTGAGYRQKNLERLVGEHRKILDAYARRLGEDLSSHKDFKARHREVTDLLERAKIADRRFKNGSFEYNYLMVYRYFSEYAHLNLKGMSHFFIKTEKGFLVVRVEPCFSDILFIWPHKRIATLRLCSG